MIDLKIDGKVLSQRVRGRVKFSLFRDGSLWYQTEDGWLFPVNVTDTASTADQGSTATFLAEDKGVFFMRWIRKAMEKEADDAAERVRLSEEFKKELAG